MQTQHYVPQAQMRSSSIISYLENVNPKRHPRNFLNRARHLIGVKTYSGEITPGAKKRLSKAISCLNQMSEWRQVWNPVTRRHQNFKLAFMTLTIPDDTNITANEAYQKLLKPFLRVMKTRHQVEHYIWKAELQKRGQLHYHVTLNQFVPQSYIQAEWNKILAASGLLDKFFARFGHYQPPSTEIKAVYKVKNFEAYLIKYCTKPDPQGRKLIGRVWGCSASLQKASYYTEILSNNIQDKINTLIEAGKVVAKHLDRFSIFFFRGISPLTVLSFEQIQDYRQHFQQISLARYPS